MSDTSFEGRLRLPNRKRQCHSALPRGAGGRDARRKPGARHPCDDDETVPERITHEPDGSGDPHHPTHGSYDLGRDRRAEGDESDDVGREPGLRIGCIEALRRIDPKALGQLSGRRGVGAGMGSLCVTGASSGSEESGERLRGHALSAQVDRDLSYAAADRSHPGR